MEEGIPFLTCKTTATPSLHNSPQPPQPSLNRWQFVVLIYEWKMSANNAT